MPKYFKWIEQENYHNDGQCQRIDKRWNAETGAVEETEQTQRPHNTKDGGDFHEMLFGQMVPRIQFEDQHMIHTRRTPSININAN